MLRHSVDIPDVTLERILAIVRTPSPGSVGKLHGRERTARRTCGPRIRARAPDRASEPSAADRAIRFAWRCSASSSQKTPPRVGEPGHDLKLHRQDRDGLTCHFS